MFTIIIYSVQKDIDSIQVDKDYSIIAKGVKNNLK